MSRQTEWRLFLWMGALAVALACIWSALQLRGSFDHWLLCMLVASASAIAGTGAAWVLFRPRKSQKTRVGELAGAVACACALMFVVSIASNAIGAHIAEQDEVEAQLQRDNVRSVCEDMFHRNGTFPADYREVHERAGITAVLLSPQNATYSTNGRQMSFSYREPRTFGGWVLPTGSTKWLQWR
jgi:hypothetical protein